MPMTLATGASRLAVPLLGPWTDGRVGEWQWQGDLQPLWWVIGAGGLGVLIVILALWALVSLAPVVLALVGAALGIRWLARATRRSRPDRAVQILRERYARGEIGKDEFDAKLRDLGER
jgi:putative membrane protein